MPFLYLRDPLFLMSFCLYGINRIAIKPNVHGGFIHNHLNDAICIPFLVPIMLSITRKSGLRSDDRPPEIHEVVLPLLVWSIQFEIVFAQDPFWSKWVVGDPFDILWYSVGAFIALTWWNWYYAGFRRIADSN